MAPVPPSNTLSDLLVDLPEAEVRGAGSTSIGGLAYRSDEATAGSLFFCVPGDRLDGHDFAADAAAHGAAALIVERWLPLDATQVRVPSVRGAFRDTPPEEGGEEWDDDPYDEDAF